MKEITIVRQSLMDDENYRPYCGSPKKCTWPRMIRTEYGFKCPACRWKATLETDFNERYTKKWPFKNES